MTGFQNCTNPVLTQKETGNFYELATIFTGLPGTQGMLPSTFDASQVPLTLIFYRTEFVQKVNYKHTEQQRARWELMQRDLDH